MLLIRKAVIFAAGEGTRLRPLTLKRPKHLIPLAGKPIIYWILEALSKIGFEKIGIVVNYKADMIKAYVKKLDLISNCNFIHQHELNGTAGALEAAEKYLDNEAFLLIYGDVITTYNNMKKMIKLFEEKKLNGVVLGVYVENPWEYGVFEIDEKGFMKKVIEKPPRGQEPSNLINGGVYVFSPKILELLKDVKVSVRGEKELTDALQKLAQNGKVFVYQTSRSEWFDIGRPWDLLEAHKFLLSKRVHMNRLPEFKNVKIFEPVYIGKNVTVGYGSVIGPYTSLHDNITVGKFSKISNSVVMSNTRIGDNVAIDHSIVGEHAVIENHVKLLSSAEQATVKMIIRNKEIDTGRKFMGSVIGDEVRIGAYSIVKAGSIVYNGVEIKANSIIEKLVK